MITRFLLTSELLEMFQEHEGKVFDYELGLNISLQLVETFYERITEEIKLQREVQVLSEDLIASTITNTWLQHEDKHVDYDVVRDIAQAAAKKIVGLLKREESPTMFAGEL